ncbi:NAD(P)-binding domain protein [Cordyceps fumosorosea ARSEF 2679]|uniref:NAD(P)-binding domain protein n=1 Tax=Cordyceps fumosorosea (strain ARSEF 2679) TaxID=1081104 RepID=A0A167LCM9_CORFA|nr:NAD(P)-binding domain protein [Cordyceps fumosorosea ARSEF 2679]OAA52931.1 NAD(P)-binding domain protein [Cordyceps fumosorosea ARSEF 2679]
MSSRNIAFLGASTGVGLGALKHSLKAGHECVALCREPKKLDDLQAPNLKIIQGNAHDLDSVSQLLVAPNGTFVDEIITTIGGKFSAAKMGIDQPQVCEVGMDTILAALAALRKQGVSGAPHITACSSTGVSKFGRDIPLLMVPLYMGLKGPHADKVKMEEKLLASGEAFTIVRPSLLTNGESERVVRAGVEDPKTGYESKAIGYTISREDAGKWIARNLVQDMDAAYLNKMVAITY